MSSLSPNQIAELRQQIAQHQLDAVADYIMANATACYAIVSDGPDLYTTVGNTRFGGKPDLPPDFAWPCDGDRDDPDSCFANFIAQINFAELPPLFGPTGLPQQGILYLWVRSMESAAEPVVLDAYYFKGDITTVRRAESPPSDRLCDEYLTDLLPQTITAVPAISLPHYREDFRTTIEQATEEIDGKDGTVRREELEDDLRHEGQIGQILGYANAGDIRENLYRYLHLGRAGRRNLIYNDYWDSLEDYEAEIQRRRERGDNELAENYESMRLGVTWLAEHRAMIEQGVAAWQLLLRLDSNAAMDLWINDADPLYVFIRTEALAKRDFSDLAGEVTQG